LLISYSSLISDKIDEPNAKKSKGESGDGPGLETEPGPGVGSGDEPAEVRPESETVLKSDYEVEDGPSLEVTSRDSEVGPEVVLRPQVGPQVEPELGPQVSEPKKDRSGVRRNSSTKPKYVFDTDGDDVGEKVDKRVDKSNKKVDKSNKKVDKSNKKVDKSEESDEDFMMEDVDESESKKKSKKMATKKSKKKSMKN
jgi:hypothetical protein